MPSFLREGRQQNEQEEMNACRDIDWRKNNEAGENGSRKNHEEMNCHSLLLLPETKEKKILFQNILPNTVMTRIKKREKEEELHSLHSLTTKFCSFLEQEASLPTFAQKQSVAFSRHLQGTHDYFWSCNTSFHSLFFLGMKLSRVIRTWETESFLTSPQTLEGGEDIFVFGSFCDHWNLWLSFIVVWPWNSRRFFCCISSCFSHLICSPAFVAQASLSFSS